MRLPSTESDVTIPNLMPLIDIVFLLLIFFLVVGRIEQEEREVSPVALPEVVKAAPISMTRELDVIVTSNGKYKVAGQEYSDQQLSAFLQAARKSNPDQAVLIRGDAKAPWEFGVRAVSLCEQAEIKKYRVAVREKE